MLLLRVGVSKLEAAKLRELADGDRLESDLAQARAAVKQRACARGERPQQVFDALDTISKLGLALELIQSDPERSQLLVNEVDRRWLRLILFGAREHQQEIASLCAGPGLALDYRPAS